MFLISSALIGFPSSATGVHRRAKSNFARFDLPRQTAERCRTLVRSLGLRFGAIDLVLSDGEYYFLEINPTGEWAWLVDAAGLPKDAALAEALSSKAPVDVG